MRVTDLSLLLRTIEVCQFDGRRAAAEGVPKVA